MFSSFNQGPSQSTNFQVKDPDTIISHLKALHSSEDKTNWVLLGYEKKNEIVFTGSGSGGVEEFKAKLVPDQIQYGALELSVQGDDYNPIKFVLMTWIGPKVSPGLGKARASAHRDDVFELVKKGVAISAQHQAENLEDITYEQLAQAISRYRPAYGTSAPATEQRQVMSRSTATKGTLSTFQLVDREAAEAALRSIHEGVNDWVILAYVQGKKDEVELVTTGKGGLDGLRAHFPTDRIFYGLYSTKFKSSAGEPIKKNTFSSP